MKDIYAAFSSARDDGLSTDDMRLLIDGYTLRALLAEPEYISELIDRAKPVGAIWLYGIKIVESNDIEGWELLMVLSHDHDTDY